MPTFLEQMRDKARTNPKHVVLQEGDDERSIEAASLATREVALLSFSTKGSACHLRVDKVPCCDLSRGCKALDILNVIAINVVRFEHQTT